MITGGGQNRERRIGFGVIGARSMVATRDVMPAIDASTEAHLVAVSSMGGPVPERWAHLGAGTYDDVLGHPDVDVVYIPLPNGRHREWVERAAGAGKHVLCETPLAPTAADARAMVDACADAGVMLVEAWTTPFDTRWQRAVELAASGGIGNLLDIDSSFTFTIDTDGANHRWSPDQGGGALLDVGIHCLGPIVALWGAHPDAIDATALWDQGGVDARTEATLSWVDGREARIRCSFVDDDEQRIEVVGTEGALIVDGAAHTGGRGAESFVVVDADGRLATTPVAATDPVLGMVDAFARAVRGDEPWPRKMSDTLELVSLLEHIADACRE